LYIQLKRLHGSLELEKVLDALNEALVNILGTEDFALFLFDDESQRFEKLYAVGARAAQLPAFAAGDEPGDAPALIRLRGSSADRVLGVIVVAHLLGHKQELHAGDRLLLADLADHAGLAIEAALLARKADCRPVAVRQLRGALTLRTLAAGGSGT
jgi:GAF domain-containing protein